MVERVWKTSRRDLENTLLLLTRDMYNHEQVGYLDALTSHYANIYKISIVYRAFMYLSAFFVKQYVEVNEFVCSCRCT